MTSGRDRAFGGVDRIDRLLLLGAILLVCGATVAIVGARSRGWMPMGDEAVVATRSADLARPERTLLGMPSSLEEYTGVRAYHPGPLLFAWLAPFTWVLGIGLGSLVGAAALNATAAAAAAVAARVVGGPKLAVAALLGAGIVLVWFAPVYQPLNSAACAVATYAVVLLAWAVAAGHRRAVLPLVAVASLVAQAHVAYGVVAVVVAAPVLVAHLVASARDVRCEGRLAAARAVVPMLGFGILLWVPPFLEDPGNLATLLAGSSSAEVGGRGPRAGFAAIVHLFGTPRLSPDLDYAFSGAVGAGSVAVAVASVALLTRAWQRHDPMVRPAIGVVALAAGAVGFTVARMPQEPVVEVQAWWFQAVSVAIWLVIGCAARTLPAVSAARRWWARPVARPVRMAGLVVGIAAFAFLGSAMVDASNQVGDEAYSAGLPTRAVMPLATAVDEAVTDQPVALLSRGAADAQDAMFGLAAERIEAGVRVQVTNEAYWGVRRLPGGVAGHPRSAVLVTSAPAESILPSGWSLLASVPALDPVERAELSSQVAQHALRSGPVVLGEAAPYRLAAAIDGHLPTSCEDLDAWAGDPDRLAIEAPGALLEAYRAGLVASPRLSADLAARVDRLPAAGVWAYNVPVGRDPARLERPDRLVLSRLGCRGAERDG